MHRICSKTFSRELTRMYRRWSMGFLTLISRQKVKVAYIYFYHFDNLCSSIIPYSEFCLSINPILLDFPHRIVTWEYYRLTVETEWRNYFKEKVFAKRYFFNTNLFSRFLSRIFPSSLSFLYFPAFKYHGKFTSPEETWRIKSN